MSRFKKSGIECHREGYGRSVPAVNVKVYKFMNDAVVSEVRRGEGADERFTMEWIEEHLTDGMIEDYFWAAVEDNREQFQEDARDIFGVHTEFYYEGRSGGWCTPDWRTMPFGSVVAAWDAVTVSRWGRFASLARIYADDVARTQVQLILFNQFEPWLEEVKRLEEEALVEADGTVALDAPSVLL